MTKATILIVDDTEMGRQTLEALLITQNYNLEFASDGHEAIKKAKELIPDLILLDVMMPDMDGYEVCRQIRQMEKLAEVPIVMVTVLDNRESKIRGIEAGADDFISKPFDKEELRVRVNTIVRLNRYRQMIAERTKFEWAVDNADDGYMLLNENDEILYINKAAKVLLNLPEEPNIEKGKKFLDVVKQHYRTEPEEAWMVWPPVSKGRTRHHRYLVRNETYNSQAFWLQVLILNEPGGLKSQRLIRLRDVTSEISAQRNIRTFQAMVSHKMRTPLTTMLYSFKYLKERADKLTPEKTKDLIDIAVDSLERLRSEIDDVLQYVNTSHIAFIGAGFTFNKFHDVLEEIAKEKKFHKLSIDVDNNAEDAQVRLSDLAIRWIIVELIENAIKFHPKHDPDIEITAAMKGDTMVNIKVKDNGVHLSPEHLEKAWSPYYQAEKHFTGEVPGMGLGLSVVESLIWEIGGSCRLINRDDNPGIIVDINLPIEEPFYE